MTKNVLILIAGGLLVLLVGCAAPMQRDLPPVIDTDPQAPGALPEYPSEDPAIIEPDEEVAPPVVPRTNPAVQSLVNQSRAQYNARNYQSAIATAERGLRIDRRTPELYLLLAQSYVQLAMPQQAEQFARQGLRYSQAGSAVAEGLQRVQQILAGGN